MKSLLTDKRFGLASACVTLGLVISFPLIGQDADPEEAREKAIVDRFVTVLEKNPRRGTALDKIYGFHVERGSLDGLIKSYREKAEKSKGTEAGSAWMIVGLMESLRGQDAASVAAFGQAEELDTASYLAPYYLGQALVLVGQPDKAAEAFERAIERKPAQADLLDVYQALGRVFQRAQKSDKALDVWNRLEKQFPNDARVQEQIATTLLEEGEFAAALPRFENLAKTTKDRYRQSLFQMETAEIKVRLNKSADALKEFEKLLGQLNPDNWLFREVRRRIEQVFLRTDDQAGLIAYYEGWMKKNPEDLEAISRLARLLAGLGRAPEAQQWLEKGLKAAPSKKDLRYALINQLIYEQKYPEAIAQYEQLDKHEPNNPDTLREWGRLVLKDTARDEATRRKDAAAVWRRLTTAKPKDALIASQVAELFRAVEMTDEALELYRKSIELAPEAAQYKEYLGEYFHSLQRKDEALATWRQMADGKSKTAANVARLAEVLAGFGYLAEAVDTNAEACKLDPKEINLQIKQADLLSQADRHEDALKQLDVVRKLAANDEEREAWIQRQLKELQALDKLKDRIAELRKELASTNAAKLSADERADQWYWLARAHESERQLKEAAEAVSKASELAPQSVPILMSSGRIMEAQNNLLAAVEINTKLAAIDRRYRTEYLKKVAQLEQQLGRRDKAIQAGRDLLAAAPGNPELYEFFSQLCFQLGEQEEGLQALRRSVRVNPTEPKGLLLLASALGEQFRTGESIELYWRAFDKAGNLEDRLGVVPKLTELYLQTNQFDRLLERLERQRREPNQQREMTICLGQAYQSAGDDGNARQELEKLLTEETRDTQLLQQLVKLCESGGDVDAAIRYQMQMNKAAPGKEGQIRLAQLLLKAGESEEASALLAQATAEEKDPEQVLKSLDSLLTTGQNEQVLRITSKMTRDQPKNWELLYREGAALGKDKPTEAVKRFEAILGLKLPDAEQSLAAKNQSKKATTNRSPRAQMMAMTHEPNSLQNRVQNVWTIRQAVGLDRNDNYYGGGSPGQRQQFWSPQDYGQARVACFAWLMSFATNDGKENEFVQTHKTNAEKATDRRALIDWYYLVSVRHDSKEQYEALKRLTKRPDADTEVRSMYLSSLWSRGGNNVQQVVNDETGQTEMKLDPLEPEELEHVLAIYREIGKATEMHNWGQTFLELVAAELKRSGRTEESEKMLADALANAKEPQEIAAILPGVVQRGEYDTALKLLDRLAELGPKTAQPNTSAGGAYNYAQYASSPQYQAEMLGQLMHKRAKAKKLEDVLALWNRYLNLVTARQEAAKTAPATPQNRRQQAFNPYGSQQYYNIWRTNQQYQQGDQIDFPSPNDIYDHSSIQMLRQTFVLYQDAEKQSDLIETFAAALKDSKTPEAQKRMWQFGLGYLYWWNNEKDESLAALTDAAKGMEENVELRFELARLHEKRSELDEALALIDSLTPSDQTALQQREIMALRLSVNSGQIDRARTAAERLFALRLDSNLQMALAKQMHQLGMHEQAEAVLARAGRQAGNKTDVMVNLMEQYAATGKNEVAVQIAHQLLRRSSGSRGNAMAMSGRVMYSGQRDESGSRQQALQVLNRSGKLPEMIEKVEQQLKNSPKSQRLLETLLEYHTAAGNDKKIEEINAKLAESKADDPQFKYQLGMKLLQAGKTKEASEHFKVVFQKEPRLIFNRYWEIENQYSSHNKLEDLATLYEEIDLKVFRQQPYVLTNVISNMSYREQTKARALTLFKKAWEVLPEARSQLLGQMHDENFWKLPEIYDYARQGIIPTETLVQQNRWQGFGQTMSYGSEGKITTLFSRVLDIAARQKKLDALGEEIAQAVKKFPNWIGGEALLGMINLRRGRIDEAKGKFEVMMPSLSKQTGNDQYYVAYAEWEIAQELMAHEPCIDLAIKYFELAASSDRNMNEFQYTPGKPLMELLKKRGRKDEARQVLIKGMNPRDPGYNDPQYMAYRRVANAVSIGNEFRNLGYPADAIKIYQRAISNADDLTQASRWGGDQYKQQLQNGMNAALAQLKPESLVDLLAPSKGIEVSKDAKGKPTTDETESVDLILLLESRELDKTRMASALANLISGLTEKSDMLEKTKTALKDARTKRPDDLATAILDVQIALAAKDPKTALPAIQQLAELVGKMPLDPPPAKGGFTAKQRSAAMQQAALWLVARDALKHEALREAGVPLAERALEGAKRQVDNGYALAILREWGQIALTAGDKQTAERRWTEMLELVLPKPAEKPKKAAVDGKATPMSDVRSSLRPLTRWEQMLAPALISQLAAPVLSIRGSAAPAPPSRTGAVTFPQFEQAAQIAKLAAEHGMNELSLRAMTQALHGGPPLEAMQDIQASNPFGGPQQVNQNSEAFTKIQDRLASVEQMWRQHGVSDDDVYAALRGAVLPETRPLEVFLYPKPLAQSPSQPQSVGALLVLAAVKANKLDDLRAAIEPRLKQPLGELSARILLSQLALASRDTKTAREQIEELGKRLQQDSLDFSSELACHVAVPAMTLPDLPPTALVLLERAVDHFRTNITAGRGSMQEEPTRSLCFTLARFHFRNGNHEAGKKQLNAYLTLLGPLYSRYSGDYGPYRRKLEMLNIAAEYARAGLRADSLDLLGRYADVVTSRDYQVGSPGRAGASILNGLAGLKASERYEALKTWSMPTADRQSVRVVTTLLAGDKAPRAFDSLRGAAARDPEIAQLASTADLLVSAAVEAGQLAELQRELQPLVDKNVENAWLLMLLVRIAKGEGNELMPQLTQHLTDRLKPAANTTDARKRAQLNDALIARAALFDKTLRPTGEQLAQAFIAHTQRSQDHLMMGLMRHEMRVARMGNAFAHEVDHRTIDMGLSHWIAGSTAPAATEAAGAMPMWWVAHEGLIGHVCSPDVSHLYFAYPLTGTFEFECEGYLGGHAEGNIGYGGLVFNGLHQGSDTQIFPVGHRADMIHRPNPLDRADSFNRIGVKAQPGKTSYFVNGHLIYEDKDVSPTSPWVMLYSERSWETAFRNPTFRGSPQIPREVALTHQDSLVGWTSDFYGETQPGRLTRRKEETPPTNPNQNRVEPSEYDWSATDGEIRGRVLPSASLAKATTQQSRLYYHRPLRDGEAVRYEFWYEPGHGGSHVHPALDRLAFVLAPEGVKLHWMTDGNGPESFSALPPDNLLEDPSCRRGPKQLPLSPKDWNTVIVTVDKSVAVVTLNGLVVCERPLEVTNDRHFGFFHDKSETSVKVRNVVLTGDWPKTLSNDVLANLLAPTREPTAEERRALTNVIDEKFYASNIDEVLLQTRAMPLVERYAALKNWVLPNDDHTAFRLYADTAPSDPLPVATITLSRANPADLLSGERESPGSGEQQNSAPASTQSAEPGDSRLPLRKAEARRTRSGGGLIAPALDLVAAARELGKLDELADAVQAVPNTPPQYERSRLAMLVLIAMASDNLPVADAAIKELTPLCKAIPDDGPKAHERWPELLAAWEAIRYPQLRSSAVALFTPLIDSQNRKGVGFPWEVKVRSARQHAIELQNNGGELPAASSASPKGQWAQVTMAKAESRGFGMAPRWGFRGNEAVHLGGHGNDLIYFQSPLRGKFTVECEQSTFGWRETRVMYGTQWAAPNYTHESVDLGNLSTNFGGPKLTPKLDPLGDWYRCKVEIEPGKATYFANDRQIYEQSLPENADPWLAIHSFGHYGGGVRALRITGQPEIPTELQLSQRDDLSGWWADMYGDPMPADNPTWKKQGDEITGRKLDGEAGRSRQSVLQYHRPLLEDGEITYEFFYVAGQTHVHPALGRTAFLLEPDGVKIHWLTDAQYERTGLAPDNAFAEKGLSKLPLKEGEWNKVALAVKGDTVTLALNDTPIYERPIESFNQRTFGLFRYAGDTDVRVKSVVYRGDWPKTLPELNDQELAGSLVSLASFADDQLPARVSWNFHGPQPKWLQTWTNQAPNKFEEIETGTRILRPEGPTQSGKPVGFAFNGLLTGDFEVTLSYRDFESKTEKTDYQAPRIEVHVPIGGAENSPGNTHAATVGHRRLTDGKELVTCGVGERGLDGKMAWKTSQQPTERTAGRLRLVRKGRTIFQLTAPEGSEEWTPVGQRVGSDAPISVMSFALRCESKESSGTVTFTEVSIRAKQITTGGITLGATPGFAENALPARLTWNFQGALPPLLIATGVGDKQRIEQAASGVKLVRELNAPASTIGYEMRDVSIKGDFVATLDYDQFETKNKPTGDGGAVPRVEMILALGGRQDQPHTHLASYMHRRERDGRDVNFAFVGTKPKQGGYSWAAGNHQFAGVSGRLRIIRQGSSMTFQRADAGSNDWTQVARHPAGQADVKQFVFGINAQDPESTASVLLTGFTLEATGIASIGAATFDANALPARLDWNFRGERPAFLKQNKTATPNLIEPTDMGLKLTRAANAVKGNDQLSLQWNGLIQGDFEVTADYRDYKSKSIGTDWKVPRVELSSFLHPVGSKDHSHVFAVYHERKANSEAIQGQVGTRTPDNQFTWTSDIFSQERSAGRLRLARKGNRCFYLTAPPDSNDWTLIGFNDLGNEDLRQLILSVRSDDLTADVTATLTNLSIRADKIEGVK